MEWFEKVKDTAAKTAQIAKEKSGELYEITKLSISISDCETKIEKMFKNAGILVYRDYENGAEISEDIKMIMQDVDSKFKEIEDYKKRISELKSICKCPSCGSSNPQDSNYCLNCGGKMNSEKKEEQKDTQEQATEE